MTTPPPPPGYQAPAGYPPPPGFPAPAGYQAPVPGFPLPPAPPALSPAGQPLADFGTRFLATLVDWAIFFVLSLVLMVPVMIFMVASLPPSGPWQVSPDGTVVEVDFIDFLVPILLLQLGFGLVMLVVAYVYHVELMFRTGQTLGKRIMKIRIVPLDPAATLTRGTAVRRFLVQFVASQIVPFLIYLDGLWQLWDKPYQQCLHDKAAGTVVVKVPG